MRVLSFASRNRKEILRDPLSILFGVGFPVALMIGISMLMKSVKGMPADIFGIDKFAPSMVVFGFSFLSMFLGMLMANDRGSSFLARLFSTPLKSGEYILGYSLPMFIIAIFQGAIGFITAIILGMSFDINIIGAIGLTIPVSAMFISFGLLMGTVLNNKQVSGVGTILVNAAVWLSGTWFSLDAISGAFKQVCIVLPFSHALDIVKYALAGEYKNTLEPLAWILGYTVVLYIITIVIFKRKMKG